MATLVLKPDPTNFPPGTVVKVKVRSSTGGQLHGEPSGSTVTEPTVANNGSLTVTGLTESVEYVGWHEADAYLFFKIVPAGGAGAVESVNGKVGVVTLVASDVSAVETTDSRLSDERTPTALSVTTAKLAALAVTEAKIAAGAVTEAKLGALAVSEAKLAAAVTAKLVLAGGAAGEVLARKGTTEQQWIPAGAGGPPTGAAGGALTGEYPNPGLLSALPVEATAITTATTLTARKLTRVDATAGALLETLPAPVTDGELIGVEKTDSSANEVSIEGNIRGTAATTITLKLQNETATLAAKGGSWYPVAKYVRIATLDTRYIRTTSEAVLAEYLAASAVTNAKLATDAVTTAKIKNGEVTSAKIAEKTVTGGATGNIAATTITSGELGASAVTEAKIAAEAVTAAKLATNAVEAAKIKAEAVEAAKLASEAVETAKIKNLAVTTGKLAAEAVTAEKRTKITLEVVRSFAIAGEVKNEKYPGFFINSEGWSITKVEHEILEGTEAEYELLDNAVAITGYTAQKVKKERGTTASTKAMTANHKIDLKVVAGTATPKGLTVTVTLTKEV